jgi:hypothetical protein
MRARSTLHKAPVCVNVWAKPLSSADPRTGRQGRTIVRGVASQLRARVRLDLDREATVSKHRGGMSCILQDSIRLSERSSIIHRCSRARHRNSATGSPHERNGRARYGSRCIQRRGRAFARRPLHSRDDSDDPHGRSPGAVAVGAPVHRHSGLGTSMSRKPRRSSASKDWTRASSLHPQGGDNAGPRLLSHRMPVQRRLQTTVPRCILDVNRKSRTASATTARNVRSQLDEHKKLVFGMKPRSTAPHE